MAYIVAATRAVGDTLRSIVVGLVLMAAVAPGCTSPSEPGPTPDSSPCDGCTDAPEPSDVPMDTAPMDMRPLDASADTAPESAADAPSEEPLDVATDVLLDVTQDALLDAATDVLLDVAQDAPEDALDVPRVDVPMIDVPQEPSSDVADASSDQPDVPTCSSSLTRCGDAGCVDLQTSVAHCGRCDLACPAATNGTAACVAGACALADKSSNALRSSSPA